MTADDVLARGEELRQQGVDDGGGLWANAEYVDWLVEHAEALMRDARERARLQAQIAEMEALLRDAHHAVTGTSVFSDRLDFGQWCRRVRTVLSERKPTNERPQEHADVRD